MAAKMESLALRPTQIQNGVVSAWGLEGADKARALEAAATLDGRPHGRWCEAVGGCCYQPREGGSVTTGERRTSPGGGGDGDEAAAAPSRKRRCSSVR